jgi:uncharacterized membrane protein YgdD (TMEM256/DUF423 family)
MLIHRVLLGLAALMGAGGVVLAALSAHGADAARLVPASSMLLFHASAVLGTTALALRGPIHAGFALVPAWGFVAGAALFAGDLTLRQFAGHALFPLADHQPARSGPHPVRGPAAYAGI